MGDDPQLLRLDAELGQRVAAALAVHDDPVEAREEAAPEVGAVRGAAGEEIVRREHGRQVRPEQERVELRRGEPLHVEDVGLDAAQRCQPERVLRDLDGKAQAPSGRTARDESG